LQQLRQTLADGVPPAPVLMDPAYGNDSKLRAGISELGLTYVAGILPTTMVWRPGEAALPPASRAGRGRPGRRLRRDATHQWCRRRHWLWSLPLTPGSRSHGGTVATRL
jgi:SRSO17 transposase